MNSVPSATGGGAGVSECSARCCRGIFTHAHAPTRSDCRRLSMWPADILPARGWQQRASERAARVARCIVVAAFTCGASVRRLSTDGQTRRTNSGRKEGKGCMRRGGSGDGQRSKEPPPALLRSAGMVASRPRFNRRNGPNQRGGWIGHFLFSSRRHLWICKGSQHAWRASCACGLQCNACTSPPRAPPPCARDRPMTAMIIRLHNTKLEYQKGINDLISDL